MVECIEGGLKNEVAGFSSGVYKRQGLPYT